MRRAALALLLVAGAAGCADADGDGPALGRLVPGPAVELTRSGGCGDVLLWAVDEAGTIAVTVAVDLPGRARTEPLTVTGVLPDEAAGIAVEVRHGEDLERDLCAGAGDGATTSPAVEGRVEVTVDPARGCGATTARFRLDGVVADDGTTLAPVEGATDAVGCPPP